MQPTLGYIGIGLMGKPMVLRLLAAGYEVTVWNRSREKLAPVLAKGAKEAASPGEVARAAGIVMMCVADQAAAEEVLFSAEGRGGQEPSARSLRFARRRRRWPGRYGAR